MYYDFLNKRISQVKHDLDSPVPSDLVITSLKNTRDYFLDKFGRIDVPLKDFQKHVRGDVELPVSGLVDMIAATSTANYNSGMVKAVSGDSYIMLIRYGDDQVEVETVLPYGASAHANSPHYTDQMHMYVNHKRKKMSLDKDVIMKSAIKIYHPK